MMEEGLLLHDHITWKAWHLVKFFQSNPLSSKMEFLGKWSPEHKKGRERKGFCEFCIFVCGGRSYYVADIRGVKNNWLTEKIKKTEEKLIKKPNRNKKPIKPIVKTINFNRSGSVSVLNQKPEQTEPDPLKTKNYTNLWVWGINS